MASAFDIIEVTTEEVDLFNATTDGGPCATYKVKNSGAASADLLVNVVGLHKPDEWFPIYAGESELFRAGNEGIIRIRAKSKASSTVAGGIVAKIHR